MEKEKKTGILGKLFGNKKKDSCCKVELEEVSGVDDETIEESNQEKNEKKIPNGSCCSGCC